MRKYIKSDGTITYHKQCQGSGPLNLDVITLPEKLFILTFYTETNRETTANWVPQLLHHLSKQRVYALIDHYRAYQYEYYTTKNGVMTRMF